MPFVIEVEERKGGSTAVNAIYTAGEHRPHLSRCYMLNVNHVNGLFAMCWKNEDLHSCPTIVDNQILVREFIKCSVISKFIGHLLVISGCCIGNR